MRFFLFFILFHFSWTLNAETRSKVYTLNVNEDVNVYEEPNIDSEILKVLKPGEKWEVRLAKKKYFLILSLSDEDNEEGFVFIKQLKKSKIKKTANTYKKYEIVESKLYQESYSFGLRYHNQVMSQAGYQDTINEVSYQFSEFKSSHPALELQIGLPTKNQWQWQIGVVSYSTNFISTANVTSINKSDVPVEREQTLFGLSFHANYYFSKDSNFYAILGLELDKGLDLKLSFDNQELVSNESDLPMFAIGQLGLGMRVRLFSGLYLSPEAQLGVDLNSDPLTLIYSLSLGLNWRF